MGEYNRTRVENEFSLSRMVGSYRDLFARTVDEGRG
jgi:hypothetical protein